MTSSLLAQRSFWLETPASTGAQSHDLVFYALLYTMAFFFFLVIGVMLLFVVLYRRRKGQYPKDAPTHNALLEIAWTVIPLIIVLAFFVVGLKYYVEMETPPVGADVVDVEASQWKFNFKYPNGAESDELYLLVNRPVVFKLVSKDVTHALFIPAFRVQRNAVPGLTTEIWVNPTEVTAGKDPATGEDNYFHVFCTQYCGNGHSEMHSKAFVLNKADYDKRLEAAANIFVDKDSKQPLPYAKVGEKLYTTMGCSSCHSIDGKPGTGPTWKGLYKSDVEFSKSNEPGYALKKTDDDKKWDDYLRESILHPEVKIVQTFENKMPSQESGFSGSKGKEMKLQAIIEYIKSLGDPNDYKAMKTPEPEKTDKPPSPEKPAPERPASPEKPADKQSNPDKPQSSDKPQSKVSPTPEPAAKAPKPEAAMEPKTGPTTQTPEPAVPKAEPSTATLGSPEPADHFADRPADPPVDKSAGSSPDLKKPDLKKEEGK
jgi:cytochrome c oxidase subunit 2